MSKVTDALNKLKVIQTLAFSEDSSIVPDWNFYKYLVNGSGRVVGAWGTRVTIEEIFDEVQAEVKKAKEAASPDKKEASPVEGGRMEVSVLATSLGEVHRKQCQKCNSCQRSTLTDAMTDTPTDCMSWVEGLECVVVEHRQGVLGGYEALDRMTMDAEVGAPSRVPQHVEVVGNLRVRCDIEHIKEVSILG
ncbi:Glutathione peroxidase 7 [Portunus trituberculatus]|uniref:Glutathione peroxidase 7 n=1 Tax=Portunus trituberculatus TaxID=210409 RepID=A0A5B7EP62_PORTR|nr:Glutathione peroxidase 7 [Portunus trituberculatus]